MLQKGPPHLDPVPEVQSAQNKPQSKVTEHYCTQTNLLSVSPWFHTRQYMYIDLIDFPVTITNFQLQIPITSYVAILNYNYHNYHYLSK